MAYQLNKIYSDYANVHKVCREVLDVSDKVGIQSVLIGGSLLGMVRDGDFLPWDKDLDFAVFEDDIDKTLALEQNYRKLGYECRVHRLGVRQSDELQEGLCLINDLSLALQTESIEHCLIGGALLNLYRDGELFSEIDTLGVLLKTEINIEQLIETLLQFGTVFKNIENEDLKGISLVTKSWRVNFFIQVELDGKYGWRDLNCEHWFDAAFFPAEKHELDERIYFSPNNPSQFLLSRFGAKWTQKPKAKFSEGRVVGSVQLYKEGVMFDFIMHYVRGDKTYWYEPAANVISTKGFLPCSVKSTKAGNMLFPDCPEIFLEEHYGNWRVPVKTWDGAVDNPTIIPSEYAMQKILNEQ
ncbi:LicD family protein [Paraglaciecola marina]|uniref:LicD family protein n=1 Tax=Paraglaciecola marina TaxID=2500157 RepID=UPI00105B5EB8|nr:LicD family protein [Paraglaciecola marina]